MRMTKKVLSIVLSVLMVVSMMSVMAVATANAADFSSDVKTIFLTDAQGWDSAGTPYVHYWKEDTSYPAPSYTAVTTTVDNNDWVQMSWLFDNSLGQSVYGVNIPDDANRVEFNVDSGNGGKQTSATSNVYDGSWWYVDGNKDCQICTTSAFHTTEQALSLSADFVDNTGADSYFVLDGSYYYRDSSTNAITQYSNVSELMVAEVVGGAHNGEQFTDVNDAVKAAGNNGTVKLINDIKSNVNISETCNTTLDLNGHTITNTSGSGITLGSSYSNPVTFTIKDTSDPSTGGININKKYTGDGCISDSSGRQVVIEGGTYTSDANALYVSSDEGWTINGGTFNGDIKVVSALDVTGGTINGDINATGPSWTVDPAEVTISGGTVNGDLNSSNGSTYVVSGGTFTDDVSAYTTSSTYQNANGEVVAKAANTIYDDGDFAAAAAAGGDWYIVADVNGDGVTVTRNLKIWNSDKTHTITGDITVADNCEFAIAGRKTTNINGDITLAGQDSKVVSTRANSVILTEPYKTGQVYGVPNTTSVIYDGKEIVYDAASLTIAASKGGTFYVVDSFTSNAAVTLSKDLTLIGLLESGEKPVITVASTSSTRKAFSLFNLSGTETDLVITGIDFAADATDEKVIGVVDTTTGTSTAAAHKTVTITNSEISGFSVSDDFGAVYLHGYTEGSFTDVDMHDNGGYDVWAGAGTDVEFNGGSAESVYMNGGTSKIAVADATIDDIDAAEGTTIEAARYDNVNIDAENKLRDNNDGTWTVVAREYVAQIGDVKYESLAEAFEAAQTGDKITLLDDVDITSAVFASDTITLDLNGKTITRTNGGIAITVNTTGKLTIEDSSDPSTGKITSGTKQATVNIVGPGELTLNSGTIEHTGTGLGNAAVKLTSNAKFTMNGGSLSGQKYGVYCQNAAETTEINGGEIYGKAASVHNANSTSTLTVTGGDFTTDTNGTNFSGNGDGIAVSGGTFDRAVPEEYCADGFKPLDNGDGTYGVTEKDLQDEAAEESNNSVGALDFVDGNGTSALDNTYRANFLGVQIRNEYIGGYDNEDAPNGNALRYVAAVENSFLDDLGEDSDYGFEVCVEGSNDVHTYSVKGTENTVINGSSDDFSFFTFAIYNITQTEKKIDVRFYVTRDKGLDTEESAYAIYKPDSDTSVYAINKSFSEIYGFIHSNG